MTTHIKHGNEIMKTRAALGGFVTLVVLLLLGSLASLFTPAFGYSAPELVAMTLAACLVSLIIYRRGRASKSH